MAYQAPGMVPRRPMPTFATGYAVGQAAEGANYWRHLSVAFAPFLGPVNDPTKLLFGRAIRAGTASFSGGRPAQGPHGYGWEFTSTGNSIVCCLSNDAFAIKSGSAGSFDGAFTALIGYRKTDGTLRNHFLWGAGGASVFTSFGMRYIGGATDGYLTNLGGSVSDTFVPGASFNKLDTHVYASRRTVGSSTPICIFFDGQPVAKNQGVTAVDLSAGNLTIGSGAGGGSADLMVIDFFYFWNTELSESAIADLSADPGQIFRPAPIEFYISNGVTVPLAADITASAAVTAAASIDVNLVASISAGAVVAASIVGDVNLAAAISASGAAVAALSIDRNLSANVTASATVEAEITGQIPIGPVRGGPNRLGGAGGEAAGDPAGAGGPLHVMRARAIAGQIVRVTFDELPKAQSPAAINDGLNPSNYSFEIVDGSGTAPLAVGVDPDVIVGPAVGVTGPIAVITATNASPIVVTTATPHGRITGDSVEITGALGNTAANGRWTVTVETATRFKLDGSTGSGAYTGGGIVLSDERALDVHVDRQLVVGLEYQVTVTGVVSAFGGGMGFPYSAPFPGNVPLRKLQAPAARRASFVDIDNPPSTGRWRVDDSGDLSSAGGIDSLKKRVLRRLSTKKNAFRWLPGYGLDLDIKGTASLAQVSAIKKDARQQIMQEPEVASVTVQATISGNNVLAITAFVKTKTGAVVEASVQISPAEGVQVL